MAKSFYRIRLATIEDSDALLEIFAPFCLDPHSNLLFGIPSAEDFRAGMESSLPNFPWLVAQSNEDDSILGYSYASKHRVRPGYQWSAETAVYVSPAHHRRGIARALYDQLLEILTLQGFFRALAIIGTANKDSVTSHQRMGFQHLVTLKKFGNKFGKWGDVTWLEKELRPFHENPSPITPFSQLNWSDVKVRDH